MAGLFSKDQKIVGGKYLVLRRDDTVPPWPWFVLGASDPMAFWALLAYAAMSLLMWRDRRYVRDVWRLAWEFRAWRRANGNGDPDGPRHRADSPQVVARMERAKGA